MSATPSCSPTAASSHSRTAAMCSGSSTAKATWSAPRNGRRTVRDRCRRGSWHSSDPRSAPASRGAGSARQPHSPQRRRPHVFHVAVEPEGSQPHRGFRLQGKKYEKPETQNEKHPVVFVGSLTRDEVRKVCDKLPDVQELTDAAVAKVTTDGRLQGPGRFRHQGP